jgi:hypothetical protein
LSQTAELGDLYGIDGQRAAVDPPPGLGQQVLVVVSQVPDHVLHPTLAARPVVGDTRDPAERVTGFSSRGVHLADDRVLGAFDPGQGDHGAAHTLTASVRAHRIE